jgi:polyhydroxybutyrate depolymerase
MKSAFLAAVVAALVVGADARAVVSWETIESGDGERAYRLVAPAGADGSKPVSVVLVFHGFGQNVGRLVRSTGFDRVAAGTGSLVVYPASVGPGWNAEACCGFGARTGVDDVRFVDDMLRDLRKRFKLDPRRIYATGISNGGIFSYYLACRRAGTFAAIAPVAATMFLPCRPSRSVSVLHVHGLADTVLPFEGGVGTLREGAWPPVREGVSFWRRKDACRPATASQAGQVTIERARCARGAAVDLVTIDRLGHEWPRGPFDATTEISGFFVRHRGAAVAE